jgi:hypothetical protein
MGFIPLQIEQVTADFAEAKAAEDKDADRLAAIMKDRQVTSDELIELIELAARGQQRKRTRQRIYLDLEDITCTVLNRTARQAYERAGWPANITDIAPYQARRQTREKATSAPTDIA